MASCPHLSASYQGFLSLPLPPEWASRCPYVLSKLHSLYPLGCICCRVHVMIATCLHSWVAWKSLQDLDGLSSWIFWSCLPILIIVQSSQLDVVCDGIHPIQSLLVAVGALCQYAISTFMRVFQFDHYCLGDTSLPTSMLILIFLSCDPLWKRSYSVSPLLLPMSLHAFVTSFSPRVGPIGFQFFFGWF